MRYQLLSVFLFPLCLLAQPAQFSVVGIGGGGALFAPSISPFNSDELYLVCDMAGVYHSTDEGQSWDMFHYDDLTSTTRGKMQFTSAPDTLYTVRSRVGSLYRRFPVKSTDGGLNWTALTDPDTSLFWYIHADPDHTERLVIGTYNGVHYSDDGGSSFTEIYHDNSESMYLAGAFWDGDTIYVATGDGLLISVNGGASFSMDATPGLPSGAGFFDFAGAKEGGTTRLYGCMAKDTELSPETEIYHIGPTDLFGLYQLDHGSGNWAAGAGFPANTAAYLVDCPKGDIDTVYTVAIDPTDLPNVYKSTDGGATWGNVFLVNNNQNITTGYMGWFGDFSWFWAGPAVAIDVSDTDPDAVAVSDFGFAHYTDDGGSSWRQMYVTPATQNPPNNPTPDEGFYETSGLNLTTCHHVLWVNEQEIFVAYTDVGTLYSNDGGTMWTYGRADEIGGGNTYRFQYDPNNNKLLAAVGDLNDLFLCYRLSDDDIDNATGKIIYSDDLGENWANLHDFGHPVVWIVNDPASFDTLYASVLHSMDGGIYKSTNGGTDWSLLPAPPRTEGRPNNIRFLENGSLVVSYAARDPLEDNNFTESSGVFLSTDGGNTWQDRTGTGMTFYTQDVVIDPHNDSVWYATVFDHFDANGTVPNGGLYRTTDLGFNWERIHEFGMAHSAGIHPGNSDHLYVSHEGGGLYFTENATAAAPIFNKVQSYPYLRPKRIYFNPFNADELWVTTMGGSVWKGSLPPTSAPDVTLGAQMITLWPNPTENVFEIQGLTGDYTIQVLDANGQVFQAISSTGPSIAIDIGYLPAGLYFISIHSAAHQSMFMEKILKMD